MDLTKNYLKHVPEEKQDLGAIATLASYDLLMKVNPTVGQAILDELCAQRTSLKLIASENYASLPVQLAMGNLLTDKYSEGYIKHRFYAGCENVDTIEERGVESLKKLFGCDHAYVQPHSGADANLVAFWSIIVQRVQNKELEKLSKKRLTDLTEEEYERVRQLLVNQTLMGMSLNAGGHLTHGYRMNISSKMMRAVTYDVDPKTHLLDYAAILEQARREKPLILTVGYSAYPRLIDFAKMREIADEVGATLLVDMAHFSGLVAGGVFTGVNNPVPYAHILTSTTHKTMRGPRGGMILCKEEFKETIDKGCPLVLGGPLPHVMAAKAIAFEEAMQPSFKTYAAQIVKNSQAFADELVKEGATLITGGTDNHLLIIDTESSYGLTGLHAEQVLLKAGITINRNSIPFDKNRPWISSGIRLGTPALTTRGLKEGEFREIARLISKLLKGTKREGSSVSKFETDEKVLESVRQGVQELLSKFPLYGELIVDVTRPAGVS